MEQGKVPLLVKRGMGCNGSLYPIVWGGPWGGMGLLYLSCGFSTEPSKGVSVQQELSKLTVSQIWNMLEVVFKVRNGANRCSGLGSPEVKWCQTQGKDGGWEK